MTAPAPPLTLPAHPARIKSYVRRGGRLTIAQGRALQSLSARFVLGGPDGMPDMDTLAAAFGRAAPLILEIGFGMGEATAQIARARPQENFLGCEVHEAGVGALLKRMGEQGMDNIRIVQGDAVQLIERTLPAGSLDGIHIFFPDPWHKKRHHKRRLIQPPLVRELALRLRPGGYLHCATDWQPYAEHMLHVLEGEALLRNSAADYAPRPAWRPQTKFETRGLRLGHGVRDLHFLRVLA